MKLHSLLLIGGLLSSGLAHGQVLMFQATLNGANESSPNASLGTGSAVVTIDQSLNTMRVQVDFSGLDGTTTASHIHAPTTDPFSLTAGVATMTPSFAGFPTGVTSGTYDMTFDTTLTSTFNASFVSANGGTAASALAALTDALMNGKAYLNIHTSTFGGGEIRGFFTAVPEPGATAAIAGLAAAGAVFAYRRRRLAA